MGPDTPPIPDLLAMERAVAEAPWAAATLLRRGLLARLRLQLALAARKLRRTPRAATG
ncbi:hypothetical protein [Streptomyces sp. TP-A0356]|uniref:hypothetical protein n=1 Tax=Streptomyces sp. TP-A0356 TaxID=1359208 RepID=UPI000ABBE59C|nr:hypothetical protein [Streptomyces sp. TP-A0356]